MAKAKTVKTKLDTMSVTVLLVMSIFGGVVGYFLGKGATSAQVVSLREAAMIMKEKGMMMEDAGKLMDDKGKRMGDKEMMDKGKMMMEAGSSMSGKGTGMMGMEY
jgi:hypothetical protein